jgi:hypothetical protein
MPTYIITSPDGKEWEVDAPEGATQEQVLAYAQANTGQKAPASPMQAPTAPDLSLGDVPMAAIRNAPQSAANFAGDIWQAVTNPVETAKGLRDVAGGGIRNAIKMASPDLLKFLDKASPETPEELARREAVGSAAGQYLSQRYGGGQNILNTIGRDPVGALSDVSTLATGGAMIAPKAGSVASTLSRAAAFTDPVNLAAKGVAGTANTLGNVGATIAGNLSGAGGDALKIAYQAGQEGGDAGKSFRSNMRGEARPDEIVAVARENLDNIRQARAAEYQTNSAGWKGADAPVSFAPIDKAYGDILASMQHRGKFKVGQPQQAVMADIESALAKWRNDPASHTVNGMDALKQLINDLPYDRINAPSAGRAITQMRAAINKEIRAVAPDYAKTMDDWGAASAKIDDLTKSLSLGDKASTDSTLRKLTSVLRNNVNTNFGKRVRDLDTLTGEGGLPLMPQIAGQALNTWMPRGIQNATAIPITAGLSVATHPGFLAALAAESPRFSGELAHLAGRASRPFAAAGRAVAPVAPGMSRAATGLQSLGDLYSEDEALAELKRRRGR